MDMMGEHCGNLGRFHGKPTPLPTTVPPNNHKQEAPLGTTLCNDSVELTEGLFWSWEGGVYISMAIRKTSLIITFVRTK